MKPFVTAPFPALHTRANEEAAARAEEARNRTEEANAFLALLDELLPPAV